MPYIMTYEDYQIRYYDICSGDKEYSIGRNTEDIINDITYQSSTISRHKGILTFLFGIPRYRNSDRQIVPVPTYLNNSDIFKEEVSFGPCDVVAFPMDHYKYAYMMYVNQQDWEFYRLRGQNFNISISEDKKIVFSESLNSILKFRFIGQNYYITSSDISDEKPFILNDNFDDPYTEESEMITKSILVDYKHIYRIICGDYLLVVGGDVILYGRI